MTSLRDARSAFQAALRAAENAATPEDVAIADRRTVQALRNLLNQSAPGDTAPKMVDLTPLSKRTFAPGLIQPQPPQAPTRLRREIRRLRNTVRDLRAELDTKNLEIARLKQIKAELTSAHETRIVNLRERIALLDTQIVNADKDVDILIYNAQTLGLTLKMSLNMLQSKEVSIPAMDQLASAFEDSRTTEATKEFIREVVALFGIDAGDAAAAAKPPVLVLGDFSNKPLLKEDVDVLFDELSIFFNPDPTSAPFTSQEVVDYIGDLGHSLASSTIASDEQKTEILNFVFTKMATGYEYPVVQAEAFRVPMGNLVNPLTTNSYFKVPNVLLTSPSSGFFNVLNVFSSSPNNTVLLNGDVPLVALLDDNANILTAFTKAYELIPSNNADAIAAFGTQRLDNEGNPTSNIVLDLTDHVGIQKPTQSRPLNVYVEAPNVNLSTNAYQLGYALARGMLFAENITGFNRREYLRNLMAIVFLQEITFGGPGGLRTRTKSIIELIGKRPKAPVVAGGTPVYIQSAGKAGEFDVSEAYIPNPGKDTRALVEAGDADGLLKRFAKKSIGKKLYAKRIYKYAKTLGKTDLLDSLNNSAPFMAAVGELATSGVEDWTRLEAVSALNEAAEDGDIEVFSAFARLSMLENDDWNAAIDAAYARESVVIAQALEEADGLREAVDTVEVSQAKIPKPNVGALKQRVKERFGNNLHKYLTGLSKSAKEDVTREFARQAVESYGEDLKDGFYTVFLPINGIVPKDIGAFIVRGTLEPSSLRLFTELTSIDGQPVIVARRERVFGGGTPLKIGRPVMVSGTTRTIDKKATNKALVAYDTKRFSARKSKSSYTVYRIEKTKSAGRGVKSKEFMDVFQAAATDVIPGDASFATALRALEDVIATATTCEDACEAFAYVVGNDAGHLAAAFSQSPLLVDTDWDNAIDTAMAHGLSDTAQAIEEADAQRSTQVVTVTGANVTYENFLDRLRAIVMAQGGDVTGAEVRKEVEDIVQIVFEGEDVFVDRLDEYLRNQGSSILDVVGEDRVREIIQKARRERHSTIQPPLNSLSGTSIEAITREEFAISQLTITGDIVINELQGLERQGLNLKNNPRVRASVKSYLSQFYQSEDNVIDKVEAYLRTRGTSLVEVLGRDNVENLINSAKEMASDQAVIGNRKLTAEVRRFYTQLQKLLVTNSGLSASTSVDPEITHGTLTPSSTSEIVRAMRDQGSAESQSESKPSTSSGTFEDIIDVTTSVIQAAAKGDDAYVALEKAHVWLDEQDEHPTKLLEKTSWDAGMASLHSALEDQDLHTDDSSALELLHSLENRYHAY